MTLKKFPSLYCPRGHKELDTTEWLSLSSKFADSYNALVAKLLVKLILESISGDLDLKSVKEKSFTYSFLSYLKWQQILVFIFFQTAEMCLLTLCQVLYSSDRARNKTDTHSCPQGAACLHRSLNHHLRILSFNASCVRAYQVASVVSDSLQPYGHSPPGSSVHGILQARLLEWAAVPYSRESSWPRVSAS